jgi:hypothetical protein
MYQDYSRLGMPGTSAGASGVAAYTETQGIARSSSSGSSGSSRAARAAALAAMMTGSEVQPKFWAPEQLSAVHGVDGGSGSLISGTNGILQQQAAQNSRSAPLQGPPMMRQQQQHFVQQAALAAGNRVLGGDLQLQQAVRGEQQHSDALLNELDAKLLQLLQLRKQLEVCGDANAAVPSATAAASALQHPTYMMQLGPGSIDACGDAAAGSACVPLAPAKNMQGMPASDQALLPLQLPATAAGDGGNLLQLQMADSASKLAMMGLDAGRQPLLLQDPDTSCMPVFRDAAPVGSFDDELQYVGSGSCLPGQGPVRQARLSEVQQKMRQLADVQTVSAALRAVAAAVCGCWEVYWRLAMHAVDVGRCSCSHAFVSMHTKKQLCKQLEVVGSGSTGLKGLVHCFINLFRHMHLAVSVRVLGKGKAGEFTAGADCGCIYVF